MKKLCIILAAILCVGIGVGVTIGFVSCKKDDTNAGQIYYVAAADFFYSNDKGHSYGNGTKEYHVGETVYMKVKAKVSSNKEIPESINMKLTIPNITALDAKYYDGQPITPTFDAVQNITTYEFTITAALNAQEWEFVFQFIPNAEAEVKITLEFDDKIDAMYDKQNTVKFVEESVGE